MAENTASRLTAAEQAKLWGLYSSLESLEKQAKASHREAENLADDLKSQAKALEDLLERLEIFANSVSPSGDDLSDL